MKATIRRSALTLIISASAVVTSGSIQQDRAAKDWKTFRCGICNALWVECAVGNMDACIQYIYGCADACQ
jgi:hypothetical protein